MHTKTTICFDFGNTRRKCAIFKDGKLFQEVIISTNEINDIQSLIDQYKPTHAILSSVIIHNPEIESLLSKHTTFHLLNHTSKLPIHIPISNADTIGSDRLALAIAATTLFPQKHNLVISLGSCITYNFINKYHSFMGGSISPGMAMRFKALNTFTAKLPKVQAEENYPLLGYNTKTNILSGVLEGMAKEIDGIIGRYQNKYNNLNILANGGDIVFLAPHLENKIFVDPYLIYKGLYAINEYNLD